MALFQTLGPRRVASSQRLSSLYVDGRWQQVKREGREERRKKLDARGIYVILFVVSNKHDIFAWWWVSVHTKRQHLHVFSVLAVKKTKRTTDRQVDDNYSRVARQPRPSAGNIIWNLFSHKLRLNYAVICAEEAKKWTKKATFYWMAGEETWTTQTINAADSWSGSERTLEDFSLMTENLLISALKCGWNTLEINTISIVVHFPFVQHVQPVWF